MEHPLTLSYPINLSRGEKNDKNVDTDRRQVEILEKIINKKVGFLDTTKKNNLKTGIESEKKSKNNYFNSSRGLLSILSYR